MSSEDAAVAVHPPKAEVLPIGQTGTSQFLVENGLAPHSPVPLNITKGEVSDKRQLYSLWLKDDVQ